MTIVVLPAYSCLCRNLSATTSMVSTCFNSFSPMRHLRLRNATAKDVTWHCCALGQAAFSAQLLGEFSCRSSPQVKLELPVVNSTLRLQYFSRKKKCEKERTSTCHSLPRLQSRSWIHCCDCFGCAPSLDLWHLQPSLNTYLDHTSWEFG